MQGLLKKLPIGIENFVEMRTEDFYLVDKTLFIKQLLENWGKVNLFTRPRRFGKSLNMSMLKAFFEIGGKKSWFDGLAIAKEKQLCAEYMGKFPVISITLKGVEGLSYEEAVGSLRNVIGREAMRFSFLETSSEITDMQKKTYHALINVDNDGCFTMPLSVLESSLQTLSFLLSKHYQKNVIILIDEYDVPLDKASQNGYYKQMVHLIRKIFGNALKTNESLQFAVMTGCLRVSKESIFTGLNNLRVLSITSAGFNEYFGFTDGEVRELLEYYGLQEFYQPVKEWYDGYLFGTERMYCPWDVINYCDELLALHRKEPGAYMKPRNYWTNTSGNVIIKALLRQAKGQTKMELERLIEGGILEKAIEENLTYQDIYNKVDNIWSVLFSTGYLTYEGVTEEGLYRLRIPNREIRSIFVNQVMEWFQEMAKLEPLKLDVLCDAVQKGDAEGVQNSLNFYLKKIISIRDTASKSRKENFYHGILLGLLSHRETWYIRSNAESGEGYSDVLIMDEKEDVGIVIEIKYTKNGRAEVLEAGCREALRQIEEKGYAELLYEEGMRNVVKYGIAFYKKQCLVKTAM